MPNDQKKLAELRSLAVGWWGDEGGEAGHVGRWIADFIDSAKYDGLDARETLKTIESSMAEMKDVCDYVLRQL